MVLLFDGWYYGMLLVDLLDAQLSPFLFICIAWFLVPKQESYLNRKKIYNLDFFVDVYFKYYLHRLSLGHCQLPPSIIKQ